MTMTESVENRTKSVAAILKDAAGLLGAARFNVAGAESGKVAQIISAVGSLAELFEDGDYFVGDKNEVATEEPDES